MIEFQPSRDAASVHALLVACGKAMYERHHLTTWLDLPRARVEAKVAAGCVWEARDAGHVIAAFALMPEAPPFYDAAVFRQAGDPARYLSAVGVAPERWGSGLGRACVGTAEGLARAAGAASVRLDTAGENAPAQRFFRRLGYEQRSDVVQLAQFTLVYFEKLLSRA